jgi:hypothetical protein
MPGEDCPHGLCGPSAGLRRTVRRYGANRLKGAPEPLVAHPEKQIVRRLRADRPRPKDCPGLPRGPSTKHLATENPRLDGSKHKLTRTHEGHDEHPISRLLADRPQAPGGLSATCGQSSLSSRTRKQLLISVHGSPKQLKLLRQDLGEMLSVHRGCYAPNLRPQTNQIAENRIATELYQKARVPTEILKSKG